MRGRRGGREEGRVGGREGGREDLTHHHCQILHLSHNNLPNDNSRSKVKVLFNDSQKFLTGQF